MFDLVSKNLSADEQVTYTQFVNFNSKTPCRSGADFEYANSLRRKLGDKLCAFTLHEWHAIVACAYHGAGKLLGIFKMNKADELPKGDPMREAMISLRVLASSLKKNESHWLNNVNFEVNSKCTLGLLNTISTIGALGNHQVYDSLFDLIESDVNERVSQIIQMATGVGPESFDGGGISKEGLRDAMMKLVRFCAKNGNGFVIC